MVVVDDGKRRSLYLLLLHQRKRLSLSLSFLSSAKGSPPLRSVVSSTKRPRLCLRLSTRKGNVISIGGSPLHTKTAINLSVSFLSSAKRQALSLFLLRRIERWIVKEA